MLWTMTIFGSTMLTSNLQVPPHAIILSIYDLDGLLDENFCQRRDG